MSGTSGSIRIALNLITFASGIGSISSLIYAFSMLGTSLGSLSTLSGTAVAAFTAVEGAAAGAALEAVAFDDALKTAVQDAANLQYATAQMDLTLHGTGVQISQLNPKITQWADNSIYSTEQVTEVVRALSEHGLTVSQIMGGIGVSAIQMAESMGADPVDAANLLASTMQQFQDQGLSAAQTASILDGAFKNGIPSTAELNSAFNMVGGTADVLNISLPDLTANLDLLAQAGLSGSEAGDSLRYILQNITHPTKAAAAEMQSLGLTFFDAKGNFIGLSSSIQEMIDKIRAASGGDKERMISMIESMFNVKSGRAAMILLNMSNYRDRYNGILQQIGQTNAAVNAQKLLDTFVGAWDELSTTFTTFVSKVGGPLLQWFIGLFNSLNGLLSSVLDNKTGWMQWISIFLIVGGILAPLLAIIGAISLIVVLFSTVLAGAAPFILAFVAALLVIPLIAAGVATEFQRLHTDVKHLEQAWNSIAGPGTMVGKLFKDIGTEVQGAFTTIRTLLAPVWGELTGAIQPLVKSILPELARMWKELSPVLVFIGKIILGSVVVAIGILLSVIVGLVASFAAALPSIIQMVTGFVQMVVGVFSFLADFTVGIWTALWDLLHGNTKKAADDLRTMFAHLGQDVQLIWTGLVNNIEGLVLSLVASTLGFFLGFIHTIVGYFTSLYDTLVGHSIVPDMVNGIISWFQKLPSLAVQAVSSLVSQVTGLFSGLAGNMVTFGQNMMHNLIQGINNMAGAVGNAASNVAGRIHSFLGFGSPTKEGPGSTADQWMPNLMRMMITGIDGGTSRISNAAFNAAGAIRTGIMGAPGALSGGGNQVINVSVGSDPLFQLVMNKLTGQLQVNGAARWQR